MSNNIFTEEFKMQTDSRGQSGTGKKKRERKKAISDLRLVWFISGFLTCDIIILIAADDVSYSFLVPFSSASTWDEN